MADLNALIAQGAQFQAPVNPFVQYGQMQQLQQGEQANQLNQMKMQEMQRTMGETNAMRQLDPNSPSYLADIMRINPEKGFAFSKLRQEAKTAGTESDIKSTKLIAEKLALLPEAYRMADTPEAYLALHKSVHADPVLGPYLNSVGATPEKGMATLQNAVQTGKFDDLRMQSMQSVSQLLDSMKPVVTAAGSSIFDPRTGKFIGTAPEKTPSYAPSPDQQGYQTAKEEGYKGNFIDYKLELARASRPPPLPRPEQPPVAVVDELSGKIKYVPREESFGKTPASALEGLAPKEIQSREAKFPVAKRAVSTITATMNEIESTVDRLIANKEGLNGITGLVYGNTPALTDAARKANADLNQLKNLAFVQGLTELRSASTSGAGVGNVSNREGDRFENLKTSLERAQSFGDMTDSLRRLKAQTNATRDTVQEAFKDTYSYRTNSPQAVEPAAASVAASVANSNVVVTPDGQSHTFPTPAAAALFKKAAGIP